MNRPHQTCQTHQLSPTGVPIKAINAKRHMAGFTRRFFRIVR